MFQILISAIQQYGRFSIVREIVKNFDFLPLQRDCNHNCVPQQTPSCSHRQETMAGISITIKTILPVQLFQSWAWYQLWPPLWPGGGGATNCRWCTIWSFSPSLLTFFSFDSSLLWGWCWLCWCIPMQFLWGCFWFQCTALVLSMIMIYQMHLQFALWSLCFACLQLGVWCFETCSWNWISHTAKHRFVMGVNTMRHCWGVMR